MVSLPEPGRVYTNRASDLARPQRICAAADSPTRTYRTRRSGDLDIEVRDRGTPYASARWGGVMSGAMQSSTCWALSRGDCPVVSRLSCGCLGVSYGAVTPVNSEALRKRLFIEPFRVSADAFGQRCGDVHFDEAAPTPSVSEAPPLGLPRRARSPRRQQLPPHEPASTPTSRSARCGNPYPTSRIRGRGRDAPGQRHRPASRLSGLSAPVRLRPCPRWSSSPRTAVRSATA